MIRRCKEEEGKEMEEVGTCIHMEVEAREMVVVEIYKCKEGVVMVIEDGETYKYKEVVVMVKVVVVTEKVEKTCKT